MPLVIDKTTPHFFMWFTDGNKKDQFGQYIIGENDLPLPHKGQLDYLTRLREECQKMQKTQTPAYLVYCGDMLKPGQKKQIEDLANKPGMENLMVIDYSEVEKRMGDVEGKYAKFNPYDNSISIENVTITKQNIIDKIHRCIRAWTREEFVHTGSTHIVQSTIDATRLVLLYNSDAMRAIAAEKYRDDQSKVRLLESSSKGIVYRDFDVTPRSEELQDLETMFGYISSLNCDVVFNRHLKKMIETYPEQEEKIRAFFDEHLFNPNQYLQNVLDDSWARYDFSKVSSQSQQRLFLIDNFLKSHPVDGCANGSFYKLFVDPVAIENSFIAFDQDRSPVAANLVAEICRENDFGLQHQLLAQDPYAAVKRWLRVDHGRLSLCPRDVVYAGVENIFYNLSVHTKWHIGNDNSWDQSKPAAEAAQLPESSISTNRIERQSVVELPTTPSSRIQIQTMKSKSQQLKSTILDFINGLK